MSLQSFYMQKVKRAHLEINNVGEVHLNYYIIEILPWLLTLDNIV